MKRRLICVEIVRNKEWYCFFKRWKPECIFSVLASGPINLKNPLELPMGRQIISNKHFNYTWFRLLIFLIFWRVAKPKNAAEGFLMLLLWIYVIIEALAAAVFQLQLNQMHWEMNAGVAAPGLLAGLGQRYEWCKRGPSCNTHTHTRPSRVKKGRIIVQTNKCVNNQSTMWTKDAPTEKKLARNQGRPKNDGGRTIRQPNRKRTLPGMWSPTAGGETGIIPQGMFTWKQIRQRYRRRVSFRRRNNPMLNLRQGPP